MPYATAAELRAQIDKISNVDDTVLTAILTAATNNIDRTINHYLPGLEYFKAPVVATARPYFGSGKGWMRTDPFISATLVAVKDSATDTTYESWAATDWVAFSGGYEHPNFADLPYTGVMSDPNGDYVIFTKGLRSPSVRITARWGYSATPPADIAEACIMQSARWYKRLQGAMSDALASGELGMLLYQQSLDPDIRRILVDGRYTNAVVFGI